MSLMLLPACCPASSAMTSASRWIDVSVRLVVGVPMRAMRLVSLLLPASHSSFAPSNVHLVWDGLQVVRANTRRITTKMVEVRVFRDRADKQLIGCAMCGYNSPAEPEHPIGLWDVSSSPNPARISLDYLRPETFFSRLRRASKTAIGVMFHTVIIAGVR